MSDDCGIVHKRRLTQGYADQPRHSARHVTTLAALISGMWAARAPTAQRATKISDGTKPRARKRLTRWLDNERWRRSTFYVCRSLVDAVSARDLCWYGWQCVAGLPSADAPRGL